MILNFMYLRKIMMMALAIFGIAAMGQSQDKNTSDTLRIGLEEAKKYALEFNRDIRSAKIDVELAKKKVWETTAIGLPSVTLSADYQHQFGSQ